MKPVKISPSVALQEVDAICEHYRNRNLILAQAVADQGVMIAERDRRIAELEAQLPPPGDPELEHVEQVH